MKDKEVEGFTGCPIGAKGEDGSVGKEIRYDDVIDAMEGLVDSAYLLIRGDLRPPVLIFKGEGVYDEDDENKDRTLDDAIVIRDGDLVSPKSPQQVPAETSGDRKYYWRITWEVRPGDLVVVMSTVEGYEPDFLLYKVIGTDDSPILYSVAARWMGDVYNLPEEVR